MDARLWLERGLGSRPGRGIVEVVGPKGAGKTSHLLRWLGEDGPYHHVAPRGWRRWARPPVADVVAWDEVDRMPRLVLADALRRTRRRTRLLLLGTHRALGVGAVVHHLPPPTAAEVAAWAARRVAAAALPGATPDLEIPQQVAARVAAACQGSWRHVADELHAWAARVVADRAGRVDHDDPTADDARHDRAAAQQR